MADRYAHIDLGSSQVVLDLRPVAHGDDPRGVASCPDRSTAAAVALALNTSESHDIDALLDRLADLDRVLVGLCVEGLDLADIPHGLDILSEARARQKERT